MFRVAGGQRIVSKMLATVTLSLTPSTTITRSFRTVKHLKVADVILGMSFLCHENATINCAEKRVVFPNNEFVQCNDKTRRANCLVLTPTKFAKLLRKSTRGAYARVERHEPFPKECSRGAPTDSDGGRSGGRPLLAEDPVEHQYHSTRTVD